MKRGVTCSLLSAPSRSFCEKLTSRTVAGTRTQVLYKLMDFLSPRYRARDAAGSG